MDQYRTKASSHSTKGTSSKSKDKVHYDVESEDDSISMDLDAEIDLRNNNLKRKRAPSSKHPHDSEEEEEEEDEDEEDDDDEEEDDDDDDGRPSRASKKKSRHKKKKKSINPFLELEAEVDDEEDEDEEEDYEDLNFIERDDDISPEASADLFAGALSRRELDRRRFEEQSGEQLAELAKDMDRRYKRTAIQPFRGDMAKTQQSLLPSVRDPKLWMVRCREGKEKNVVMTLMRKFFERNRQAADNKNVTTLKIHSVFCRDDLKGFIYVEADLGQHVQDALKEVFGIYLGKTRLVPVKEMVDVLTIQKDTQTVDLLKLEWVRIKRGKYAGDLARVVDITDTGDICTVHLIPRLDLSEEVKDKKKKKQGLLSRPPQKLFNPRDLPPSLARMVSKSQRGYWTLGPEAFKNGLLEKSVRVSALDTNCVPPPSLDEINAFVGSDGTIDTNTLQTLKSSIAHREIPNHFRPGDQVLVISGELANVPAVISGINGNLATIQAMVPGLSTKTSLPLSQLCKRFSLGDLVKVHTGKHEGEIGTIVRLQGHIATVISTKNQQEIHVTTRDLQDVKEITNPAESKLNTSSSSSSINTKPIEEPPRFFREPRRRDPLLGVTAKIQGGSFKGYLGIVKHLTKDYARVELHSNCRTVTVPRDRLTLRDETGTFARSMDFSSSSFSTGTPSHSFTPSFNSTASNQTPNPYNSYTSSLAPQTPNPHVSAQTPNPHGSKFGNDGHRTPAWDAGSRTPFAGDTQDVNTWLADDANPVSTHDWTAGTSGVWGTEPPSLTWGSTNTGDETWKHTPNFSSISSSSNPM